MCVIIMNIILILVSVTVSPVQSGPGVMEKNDSEQEDEHGNDEQSEEEEIEEEKEDVMKLEKKQGEI